MKPIGIDELAEVLDAQLHWPAGADGAAAQNPRVGPDVVIDSRLVSAGALFVALPGERVDGHGFAAVAAAAGAGAMLSTRPSAELPTLVVDDPQLALGRLSRFVVDSHPALAVVGVTGSSGKTSTKDLLAQILETVGPVVAPVGSFNNEIGVPLTACQVGAETRFLISEMGARGIGHIGYLCGLTPPTVGIELNVGRAHVGEFGGQETTALAKSELVAALPPSGVAVLNADDARVAAMTKKTEAEVAWFSTGAEPARALLTRPGRHHVWAEQARGDASGRYSFTLHVRSGEEEPQAWPVELKTSGAHQVSNALAAATAAVALGLAPREIAAALNEATPRSAWRMDIIERADGATIINDAYNANPDSMRAALTTAAGMLRGEGTGSRRGVAVLGDMLELGDSANAEHQALGALVAELKFSRLIVLGEFGSAVCRGAKDAEHEITASLANTKEEMLALVQAEVTAGDVVLVKASRGLGLETVAQALASHDATTDGDLL